MQLLRICWLLMMLVYSAEANAQKTFNNSVKLHSGSYNVYALNHNLRTSFVGAYYERKVLKQISVSIGYSQWRVASVWGKPWFAEKMEPVDNGIGYDTTRGTVIERIGYKMVDAFSAYNHYWSKQHVFSAGLGLSYCWGWNRCIESRYYTEEHGWTGPNYTEAANYWGIVPQLSYDYNFFKNRLNTGCNIRARKYFGAAYIQYDFVIHLGINF
ncbi:MAG: hypothetical protein JNL72_00845 [Flavipsychrobacter sp.]|nr:hypothetical protein [Flavipsychrobacter sp.]